MIHETNKPISVLAKTDKSNRILCLDSSVFILNTDGWVIIDQSDSGSRDSRDAYVFAQVSYLPNKLIHPDGTHSYRYLPGEVPAYRGATAEELAAELAEIEANRPIPEPSPEELQGQQITALELESITQGQMLTDLDLESIENGQRMTDLELMVLEVSKNV